MTIYSVLGYPYERQLSSTEYPYNTNYFVTKKPCRGCVQHKKGYFEKKWQEIDQKYEENEESISSRTVFTSKMSIFNDKYPY